MPLQPPSSRALPDGPLRTLVVELHHLYRQAGYPGVKKISGEIRDRDDLPDAVSHETVSKILQGEVLPRWSKLESLVRVLAGWSVDRPVPDEEAKRFQRLWHVAGGSPDDEAASRLPAQRTEPRPGPRPEPRPEREPAPAPGEHDLVVEWEDAHLSYADGVYHCSIRRALYNGIDEPITQFPIEICADRYPDDPELSNRHHHANPMTWDELRLSAACGDEPMNWRPYTDREALKEVWLLFENARGQFPLYPGQRTVIAYSWKVSDRQWGPWLQRNIRLPTRRLSVVVDFPEDVDPVVWGVRSSLWHRDVPLRTAIVRETPGDGRVTFSWSTDRTALQDRYRIEWRFRGEGT
ncbi:helix-turn-helix domain-containing protein [Dactylosporangium sp. CA-152071]|uniref:helix-turn-helix domain-containing protein n=1 Tax=Dactylosporangium sp. CA-152071 TaxID=3239933 RepID=UPI003D8C1A25